MERETLQKEVVAMEAQHRASRAAFEEEMAATIEALKQAQLQLEPSPIANQPDEECNLSTTTILSSRSWGEEGGQESRHATTPTEINKGFRLNSWRILTNS